jgi:hypothetical protein
VDPPVPLLDFEARARFAGGSGFSFSLFLLILDIRPVSRRYELGDRQIQNIASQLKVPRRCCGGIYDGFSAIWLSSCRERQDAVVHHAPKEHSPASSVAWKMPRKQEE